MFNIKHIIVLDRRKPLTCSSLQKNTMFLLLRGPPQHLGLIAAAMAMPLVRKVTAMARGGLASVGMVLLNQRHCIVSTKIYFFWQGSLLGRINRKTNWCVMWQCVNGAYAACVQHEHGMFTALNYMCEGCVCAKHPMCEWHVFCIYPACEWQMCGMWPVCNRFHVWHVCRVWVAHAWPVSSVCGCICGIFQGMSDSCSIEAALHSKDRK